jgi:hypothetical protein
VRRTLVYPCLLAAGLSALALAPTPALACPNCREAVAAQPAEVAAMARGYNWSILLMLGMPFTLLGTGAIAVARAVKRGALPEL